MRCEGVAEEGAHTTSAQDLPGCAALMREGNPPRFNQALPSCFCIVAICELLHFAFREILRLFVGLSHGVVASCSLPINERQPPLRFIAVAVCFLCGKRRTDLSPHEPFGDGLSFAPVRTATAWQANWGAFHTVEKKRDYYGLSTIILSSLFKQLEGRTSPGRSSSIC
jgi:hypothetical protein